MIVNENYAGGALRRALEKTSLGCAGALISEPTDTSSVMIISFLR